MRPGVAVGDGVKVEGFYGHPLIVGWGRRGREGIAAVGGGCGVRERFAGERRVRAVVRGWSEDVGNRDFEDEDPRHIRVGRETEELTQLHGDIAAEGAADGLDLGDAGNPHPVRAGSHRVANLAIL